METGKGITPRVVSYCQRVSMSMGAIQDLFKDIHIFGSYDCYLKQPSIQKRVNEYIVYHRNERCKYINDFIDEQGYDIMIDRDSKEYKCKYIYGNLHCRIQMEYKYNGYIRVEPPPVCSLIKDYIHKNVKLDLDELQTILKSKSFRTLSIIVVRKPLKIVLKRPRPDIVTELLQDDIVKKKIATCPACLLDLCLEHN